MPSLDALRQHLARLLTWSDAHVDFDTAVAEVPPELRGAVPPGLPYSAWQLVEHIRLTQADILAFCTNADYKEGQWPDDYWPAEASPPGPAAWDASIAAYHRDLTRLRDLLDDQSLDLFSKVPAGTGQTLLREFLLVADHTAYHVGQLVMLRRLLNAWADA